jgi:mannose-6-phosphate isomerase-like protein (cupin superfamily)
MSERRVDPTLGVACEASGAGRRRRTGNVVKDLNHEARSFRNRRPAFGGRADRRGGGRYRFLATLESTKGTYAIWEAIVPPGAGAPPHLHTLEEEGFYVIEGEVTIHVDGRIVTATAGSFVNIPVGSTHWFVNETERAAKLLILVAPGGFETFFKRVGQHVDDPRAPILPLDEEQKRRMLAVAPEFGLEMKVPGDVH